MNTPAELDPEEIHAWYNKQAINDPESAGMLSPYGDDGRLPALYRQEAEWLHFRRIVPLHKRMRVLELGCGAGRWALRIAPLVSQVVGVDFSEEMIKLARERQRGLGLQNVEFCASPVQDAHWEAPFDVVYLSGLTQNLTEPQLRQTLCHIQTMLTPRGFLIERTSVSLGIREITHYGDGYQGIYRTVQELTSLFGEFGFDLTYRALTHNRMRLPGRFLAKAWFQKGMGAGLHKFPNATVKLIGAITWLLDKARPMARGPMTRSNDFFVFEKRTQHV